MANVLLKSVKFPDLEDTYIIGDESLSVSGAAADAKATGDALATKADANGEYDNLTAGNAKQLVSNVKVNDKTPYIFRTSGGSVDIGDREYVNGIVGGSLVWNQIVPKINSTNWSTENGVTATFGDGEATFVSTAGNYGIKTGARQGNTSVQGHKYLIMFDAKVASTVSGGTVTMIGTGNAAYSVVASGLTTSYVTYGKIASCSRSGDNPSFYIFPNTYAINVEISVRNPVSCNLTQMFGSTIADYIYSLEQANAGAGVAWFRKLFPKPYYEYNAGELKSVSGLVSHDMTGFNQFDKSTVVAGWLNTDGTVDSSQTAYKTSDYIRVVPNTVYYMTASGSSRCKFYDVDKNAITASFDGNISGSAGQTVSIPEGVYYIRKTVASSGQNDYLDTYCINLSWDGSRNGEYEPYELHSYPLDTDLTLRGIPKLDANNNLYYDGDEYLPDGTVTRKYGIVDLGSLSWIYQSSGWGQYPSFVARYGGVAVPNGTIANLMCTKYTAVSADTLYTGVDKSIADNGTNVRIRDNTYTDAATFKTAMSGVYLVYELATPTTETADPYQATQIVNDFGTEEYVIDDNAFAIPVGHNTDYPVSLVAKLEMAPNSPDGSGDYIVRQTNGVNSYVPLVIEDALPTIPSASGSYVLTVTVAEGADPTLEWVAQS